MKTVILYEKTMDTFINTARSIFAMDRKNKYFKWMQEHNMSSRMYDNVIEFDNDDDATLFTLTFGHENVPKI